MSSELYFIRGEVKAYKKSLCVEMKLHIIKRHEGGKVAYFFTIILIILNLAQSTVSTVVKKAGENATSLLAKTNIKNP